MPIEVSQVKFESHFSNLISDQVKSIVSPIFDYGINLFNHCRIFQDNACVNLTTIPHFCEFFAENNLYREACVGDWDQYHDAYYFWDTLVSASEVFKAVEGQCQSSHGVTLVRKHEYYCDHFYFGGDINNPGIKNFFITNKAMINDFLNYYMNEAKHLIVESYAHRYYFPSDRKECDEILESAHVNPANYFKFNKSLLTKRELECVQLSALGNTAKMVAHHLHVAPKTVERHLENARRKMGVKTKLALINKVAA